MTLDQSVDVARVIDALDTDDLPQALSNMLKNIVEYDYTVMFGYVGLSRPLALFNDLPPRRRQLHVEDYLNGPYLLDPFFLASTSAVEPGLWRLSQIAPDRFYQGEYFRSYYARTGLAEEIGYLIDVHDGLSIVISLMRQDRKFNKAEMRQLAAVAPLIDATCRRHWRSTAKEGISHVPVMEKNVERAFRRIGEGVLTPREREVVELTLRGHSADAVGQLLGISPGTVRIHRKNIYAKLRINSQGELFSEFLTAIVDGRS